MVIAGFPNDFLYSQSSLQDFEDCPRRFQLRYVRRISWPAIVMEPALENERIIQLGIKFHQLVHRHLLGVPEKSLTEAIHDEQLAIWWGNYLQHGSVQNLSGSAQPREIYPEISLSAPLDAHRLVAKYDLIIAMEDGRFIIVDWKTSNKRSHPDWLFGRMQTRVYPYLLIRAGKDLNNDLPIQPENVEMLYWFSEHPRKLVRFNLTRSQYEDDEIFLIDRIAKINQSAPDDFPLTDNIKLCSYCVYRSLCKRGVQAGRLDDEIKAFEGDEFTEFISDFEQISEIEY